MPGRSPSPPPHLTLVLARRGEIRRTLAAQHPQVCPGRIDDALGELQLLLVRDPARFERAMEQGGPRHVVALARRVARYALHDQLKRAAYGREEGAVVGDPAGARLPGQETWARLPRDLRGGVLRICGQVSRRHADALCDALLDKLYNGADDTAVAARFGVRREFVNRAWHLLAAELLNG